MNSPGMAHVIKKALDIKQQGRDGAIHFDSLFGGVDKCEHRIDCTMSIS